MHDHLSFTRTRIAPTPSGFLHLGNALSFLITAALAKRTGAKLLLRIDDMDRDRMEPAYVKDIFDTLHFLGIAWNEGPANETEFERAFSQRHRLGFYQDALQALRDGGNVFACTCSRREILQQHPYGAYPGTCREKNLPLDTPGASWRLHTDAHLPLRIKTLEGEKTSGLPIIKHDFVVRKRDGFPAYQLTSMVDDLYFGVDLIVRGEDLWPSTLAQSYLASVLGRTSFSEVSFYHHPLVETGPGIKLSKSAGDTSIRHLREAGSDAESVLLMLRRLAASLGIPFL